MTRSPADTVKHTPLACCPFCGGKAKLSSYRVAEDAMGCHVECTSCRVQTETFEDAYTPSGDAISAWNRRSPDPVREKLVEALEAVLAEETVLVHVGYDGGAGGGNYVYADAVRVDSDAFALARAAHAAASKSDGGK